MGFISSHPSPLKRTVGQKPMLTKYLDILAFEWIRRRAKYFVRGGVPAALAHPLPMIIANDAADLIKDSGAENGVIVMFHSDRHQRDVVFDVRWADGQTIMERYFAHAKICPTLRTPDAPQARSESDKK